MGSHPNCAGSEDVIHNCRCAHLAPSVEGARDWGAKPSLAHLGSVVIACPPASGVLPLLARPSQECRRISAVSGPWGRRHPPPWGPDTTRTFRSGSRRHHASESRNCRRHALGVRHRAATAARGP